MKVKNSGQFGVVKLETCFRNICRKRMRDVAILNNRLDVEAVGFRNWQGHYLGVLITPWFISLILLPGKEDDWSAYRVGNKVQHIFPSGHYEFIVGHEETIGTFQSCSLFSPTLEFKKQDAAVATAVAAIQTLFEKPSGQKVPPKNTLETIENLAIRAAATMESNMDKPLSRRDMLNGGFLRVRE